ncbi:MAG: glycosyltransferase family 1 protein, partial [Gelidibacter sp.]
LNRVMSCFEVLNHKGDINHVTGDIHYVTYFLPKSKTLLTIHDLAPLKTSTGIKHGVLKFFWYQLPIWSVKYITVISEFTKMELTESVQINPDKIRVVPNPVPVGIEFQPKNELSSTPVLLQVGTAYNKNLEGLIEAINGLKVHLRIIGTLSNAQKQLLSESTIQYTNINNLSYKEVLEEYALCDIVCFATFYEGFGLPILEAQATGRPIITSDRCAMPETAGNGALLIDPKDSNNYRQAIQTLIADESKRNDLVQKGQINIKRFSAEAIANQYLELYKSMANG